MGRLSQGEFIYYPTDGHGVKDSHCEILCDEARVFWVTPFKVGSKYLKRSTNINIVRKFVGQSYIPEQWTDKVQKSTKIWFLFGTRGRTRRK